LTHFDEMRLRRVRVTQYAAVKGERGAEPWMKKVRDLPQLGRRGLFARESS
jgi:hypothetical protein